MQSKGAKMFKSKIVLRTGQKTTDKTYILSNDEFLLTVFSEKLGEERAVVVSFTGNTANIPGNKWAGRTLRGCADA